MAEHMTELRLSFDDSSFSSMGLDVFTEPPKSNLQMSSANTSAVSLIEDIGTQDLTPKGKPKNAHVKFAVEIDEYTADKIEFETRQAEVSHNVHASLGHSSCNALQLLVYRICNVRQILNHSTLFAMSHSSADDCTCKAQRLLGPSMFIF
jgi:hypothetical protein